MDYKRIIENLDVAAVKDLLERMDIPFQDKGDYLICKTACHNVDLESASWKLYFYKNYKIFMCYTNCQTMSIFKFLKNYYECRNIEYDWFSDIYEVVLNCSKFRPGEILKPTYKGLDERYYQRKTLKKIPTYPNGLLDTFTEFYPIEWLRDGITPAAMQKFSIKFSINQNKIIIPHFDVAGNLIGIRGRALDPWEVENIGKYMPVQIEGKWYNHPLSLNLYGLNETKENIKRFRLCFIGESEKFVLQNESFDMPNLSCAICGSSFNKYQLDLLMRTVQPREIVMCFDKDVPFEKAKQTCMKYKNYCNFSFLWDRKGLLGLKDSPTDKGQKVFEKLVEERIRL